MSTNTNKLSSLLRNKTTGKGKVVLSEQALYDLFKAKKCDTKSAMIKCLASEGYERKDIAQTLLHYGILSPKSYNNHVYNVLNSNK